MADNLDITAGAGTTIKTDDIGGVHYQQVKLVDGTLDATGVIAADIGVKANALRVVPANNITDATYIGDIKFGEGLYTEDIATPATIVGFATMVERDDALGGLTPAEGDWAALRCDANGALWVHDNVVNTLLTTIDSDTGNMLTALQLIDNAVDGNYLNVNLNIAGTDAAAGESALDGTELRVTIATDDDSVAHLNTIAGAVSATHMQCDIVAGTVTTVSTVTNLAQMGGVAITLDEGVHGAGVQRVTIATDDDGVLSLGIIDDWDATHASAASADGPQIMGAGYSAVLPTDIGADGDAARICTDRHGRIVRGLMPQWFNAVFDSANASAEANVVKAGTVSRKIYILSITISVDTEMWVKLQDEDSNALTCKHWFKAGGGKTITYPPEAPLVLNIVNKALEVITEGAGNIGVEVTGYLAV